MSSLDRTLFARAGFNAREAERTGYSNYSYWQSTFRTFAKNRSAMVMLGIMVVFSLMSFAYPLLSSVDPTKVSLEQSTWNKAPSAESWFGTDGLGRDIWARTWYGTRMSLLLGLTIALLDVGIGAVVGALWGYVRKLDRPLTELYNVISNIPSTVYLILLAYIMRPGFWTIVVAMCSTGWIGIARFMRNKVISIRDSEYNVASRCLGTPLRRLVTKNILPYLTSVTIMEAALTIPYSIGAEVFLGFIGLGFPLDQVTLGNMVNEGRANFMLFPHQLAFPTLVLAFITVSFYLVGNKFADASDPRNHV
jgi:oligopeptide transport system permease protein